MTPEEYLDIEPNFKYKLYLDARNITLQSVMDVLDFVGLIVARVVNRAGKISYSCYKDNYLCFEKFDEAIVDDVKIIWKYSFLNSEDHLFFLKEEDMVMAKLLLDHS